VIPNPCFDIGVLASLCPRVSLFPYVGKCLALRENDNPQLRTMRAVHLKCKPLISSVSHGTDQYADHPVYVYVKGNTSTRYGRLSTSNWLCLIHKGSVLMQLVL
jgi:hypothetical protein